MRSRRAFVFVFLVLACTAAALLNAATTPEGVLLVLSKGEQTLFIIDPVTLTVVGQVPAGRILTR